MFTVTMCLKFAMLSFFPTVHVYFWILYVPSYDEQSGRESVLELCNYIFTKFPPVRIHAPFMVDNVMLCLQSTFLLTAAVIAQASQFLLCSFELSTGKRYFSCVSGNGSYGHKETIFKGKCTPEFVAILVQ